MDTTADDIRRVLRLVDDEDHSVTAAEVRVLVREVQRLWETVTTLARRLESDLPGIAEERP